VLDEADMMCDMGFLPDIRRILQYVPMQRQTLFFSATMPDEIRALSKDILTDPKTVQIGTMAPVETVSHALYPVHDGMKTRMLLALLRQPATGRVLVFTRTKHRARKVARILEDKSYRVAALQGNMAQARRQQALDGFRNGKYDILVATDIASRGIDVYNISHVINYDMPMTVDAYTHRIGRAGRAHDTGEALTLMVPDDEPLVRRIERVLHERIQRRRLPNFDYGESSQNGRTSPGRTYTGGRRVPPSNNRIQHLGSDARGPNRADASTVANQSTNSVNRDSPSEPRRNGVAHRRRPHLRGRASQGSRRRRG
jgi:ATP-dependent RNA helicase RhlE